MAASAAADASQSRSFAAVYSAAGDSCSGIPSPRAKGLACPWRGVHFFHRKRTGGGSVQMVTLAPPKQTRFDEEYLVDLNGKQAAIR